MNIRELAKSLTDSPMDHPYCLQLLTYGYFYRRQHQLLPELSFHLVSSRNSDYDDVGIVLDLPRYEHGSTPALTNWRPDGIRNVDVE